MLTQPSSRKVNFSFATAARVRIRDFANASDDILDVSRSKILASYRERGQKCLLISRRRDNVSLIARSLELSCYIRAKVFPSLSFFSFFLFLLAVSLFFSLFPSLSLSFDISTVMCNAVVVLLLKLRPDKSPISVRVGKSVICRVDTFERSLITYLSMFRQIGGTC